jgi:protein-ribulosamine 3-kinase
MSLINEISDAISNATGEPFRCQTQQAVGGGCINQTVTLSDGRRRFFVKLNAAHLLDMFEAEAEGLQEIVNSASIHCPQPICWGTAGSQAYLVLEQIDFGHESDTAMEQFGHELAQMHRHSAAQFGWFRDNTIGSTTQPNTQQHDWVTFWREQRLGFQLQLAAGNGHGGQLQRLGEQLLTELDCFFRDYSPTPSLLHGDLWSGNYAVSTDGTPVIFDPAVYYGDREADLAMTELFGGFSADFYRAYQNAWPLDAGYRQRKVLYNLYHILNHLNLFGGGYLGQAQSMLQRLVAELR